MQPSPFPTRGRLALAGALLTFLLLPLQSRADGPGTEDITAVSAKASPDYVRTRRPDGSFPPETYAFARGGAWLGAMDDPTIDTLKFLDVAHVIAGPLAAQNYIPTQDPKTTKLLIMVYWGLSFAPSAAEHSAGYELAQDHPNNNGAIGEIAAINEARELEDMRNANMLGYNDWWAQTAGDHRATAFALGRQDLLHEIEQNRYFVVLMAYDFQLLWKQKKHKLLWETRFSIYQQHHAFNQSLPAMTTFASQFFGQDTHGLVHKQIPLGHVDIGELKTIDEVLAGPPAEPKN